AHETLRNLADKESALLSRKKHSNLSFDSMPPIPCEELIQLYIGDKNRNSDEQDFKKALDLLQLMGEAEIDQKEHLKLMIWCKAILRDNWSSFHGSNPLDSARQAVFFKTVQLAYSQVNVCMIPFKLI
ncbi:predicted protein, partial [Nematostella vectensis]